MSRVFLIDTDTASDDAVALIMALKAPAVKIVGITVVAGNVGVDQACRNALYTAELCGSDVPVFRGAEAPLERTLEDASWFHGQDGMGDHGYAPAHRSVEQTHAVDAIIQMAEMHPGLTIVTLGPLTNLALALKRKTDLGKLIGRCVVMGGAPCCEGNVTPAAEYNFWCDPGSGTFGSSRQIAFRTGGMAALPRRRSAEYGRYCQSQVARHQPGGFCD